MKRLPFILWFAAFGPLALAQDFVNLDFESPLLPFPSGSGFVPAANAVPGWAAYDPFMPGNVLYNNIELDGAGVSLFGPGFQGAGNQILQGSYSVFLQGSHEGDTPSSAALGQTGQIPPNAKSLLFLAKPEPITPGAVSGEPIFQVAFGGQAIPLVEISSTANYDLMGGDISALAGQTGELLFTALPNHIGVLDDISFSMEPIPEPSSLGLLPAGWVCLWAFRRWPGTPETAGAQPAGEDADFAAFSAARAAPVTNPIPPERPRVRDRGRDGGVSATPPSEPDGRISRIRLSSQWVLGETNHKHRSRVPD